MKTELQIDGMNCEHCARGVMVALEGVHGVSTAEVSLTTGIAVVVHEGQTTSQQLFDAVEAEGYTGRVVSE